jgi:23S rRNA (cytidine1920-2'-O)/16S rRNA (cytidine1409-2'-O)-methyltransferase
MTTRVRADQLLVARGLFDSRAKAQDAIASGLVTADGVVVKKPSEGIATTAVLNAVPAHPWVSRGGVKLSGALDHFGIDPRGRIGLDVGASTGGFTEVLLARGAKHVYAVDVGRDQLHPRLRGRPDVTVLEGTDIRRLAAGQLPERPDLVVVDASFISLEHVLPPAAALADQRAQMLALIKPQFEVGRGGIKKGVVRDPDLHAAACERIRQFVESLGWSVIGLTPSPIAGGDGNREFFVAASRD